SCAAGAHSASRAGHDPGSSAPPSPPSVHSKTKQNTREGCSTDGWYGRVIISIPAGVARGVLRFVRGWEWERVGGSESDSATNQPPPPALSPYPLSHSHVCVCRLHDRQEYLGDQTRSAD